jgi:phenylalanyl-tRNA synthetase beta chain
MPVVRIELPRFVKMVGADRERILERLPYLGLDIESVSEGSVRVEYSPNRPDFGTDIGIARAMRGLLGKELGLPSYATYASGIAVSVDTKLSKVRPFIASVVARGLNLDEEDVRQMISLQEDLHNGLGRKRKVIAIGLHDMDAVKPPLAYKAVDSSFRFVPLGAQRTKSLREILSDTPEGKAYGPILGTSGIYPVIVDSLGTVLSFPPVINGHATRVTPATRTMFVDVTGTDRRTCDDVLAIVATTLAEAGAKLGFVVVGQEGSRRTTPDLTPSVLRLDKNLVRSSLGLPLSDREIGQCLRRCRLAVRGNKVIGPRYRVDLLHPVDLAEEVALGYGINRLSPIYPPSNQPGSFNAFEEFLDSAATVLSGAGMIEMMTFELVDEKSLYSNFGRPTADRISVHDPRSLDHSVLRDSLLPTLMGGLSSNAGAEYPQLVFEVGRVYARKEDSVSESWQLCALIAHSRAGFSEAKMHLEAAIRTLAGKEVATRPGRHWAFAEGRSAQVLSGERGLGYVGEVKPEALAAFGLKVPVSGFEINLSSLHELLK